SVPPALRPRFLAGNLRATRHDSNLPRFHPLRAAEELPQSLSGAACVVGEIANTASSSVVDESSKLPKASGCAPLPMVNGFERDGGAGAANSSSGDVANAGSGGGGTTRGEGAGSDFAATGIGGGGVGT